MKTYFWSWLLINIKWRIFLKAQTVKFLFRIRNNFLRKISCFGIIVNFAKNRKVKIPSINPIFYKYLACYWHGIYIHQWNMYKISLLLLKKLITYMTTCNNMDTQKNETYGGRSKRNDNRVFLEHIKEEFFACSYTF